MAREPTPLEFAEVPRSPATSDPAAAALPVRYRQRAPPPRVRRRRRRELCATRSAKRSVPSRLWTLCPLGHFDQSPTDPPGLLFRSGTQGTPTRSVPQETTAATPRRKGGMRPRNELGAPNQDRLGLPKQSTCRRSGLASLRSVFPPCPRPWASLSRMLPTSVRADGARIRGIGRRWQPSPEFRQADNADLPHERTN